MEHPPPPEPGDDPSSGEFCGGRSRFGDQSPDQVRPSGSSVGDWLTVAREALAQAYAVVRDDCEDTVPPGEVLAQIAATQQLVDAAYAIQTHRLAQHAGTISTRNHDTGEQRVGRGTVTAASAIDARRFADVAAACQWGPVTAAKRCRDAVTATQAFPVLVDDLAAGAVDRERVHAVVDAVRDVPEDHLGAVGPRLEAAMRDGSRGGIRAWTATIARKRARAAVAAIDQLAPIRHRSRAIREALGVTFKPGRVHGTSLLEATVSTQQAAQIQAAIEKLAWAYRTQAKNDQGEENAPSRSGEPGWSLGQCRAQALTDLMCENATVTAEATFLIPVNSSDQTWLLRALDGLSERLAEHGFSISLTQGNRPDEPRPELSPQEWADNAREHRDSGRRPGDAGSAHADRFEEFTARLSVLFPPIGSPPGGSRPERGDATDRPTEGFSGTRLPSLEDADHATWAVGHPDDVAVPGLGVIPAETVTGLITALGPTIGRALVNPVTGTLREDTSAGYRPTAGMKRLVYIRDGSCRFPGCTRPAAFTDLDHVTPYGKLGGETSPTNLICLCRTHHRAKSCGTWQTTLNPDDSVTWTSITGTTHTTYPATEPIPF